MVRASVSCSNRSTTYSTSSPKAANSNESDEVITASSSSNQASVPTVRRRSKLIDRAKHLERQRRTTGVQKDVRARSVRSDPDPTPYGRCDHVAARASRSQGLLPTKDRGLQCEAAGRIPRVSQE